MKLLLTLMIVCTGVFIAQSVSGQAPKRLREYNRNLQVSFFPGISTNGINSASYYNKWSVNIFGGVSAGTTFFEVSPITNVNLKKSNGIQIAGLANVIGANAFVNLDMNEEKELIKAEFSSDQQGILIAGILNYTRSNAKGIHISGGFNIVGDDFKGASFAVLGNFTGNIEGRFTQGLQLSGVFNATEKSMYGTQISSFYNKAGKNLSGLQLSAFNTAERTKGKNSVARTDATGIQVGLFNKCKSMEGIQVGLFNIGRDSKGLQVGLINIYKADPVVDNIRRGTPIGLLNFGSIRVKTRVYYNEVFTYNFEFITGNCLNCSATLSRMPVNERRMVLNQNSLIGSYDQITGRWGIGYGFRRQYFRKYSLTKDPRNQKISNTFGMQVQHINQAQDFERSLSLLGRLTYDVGIKYRKVRLLGGLTANYFVQKGDNPIKVRSVSIGSFWPGYSVGIEFL